ncbi:MAG TPA: hypothetical protein VMU08_13955 [Rhizomicrobium sp.]|nr:hypothetical protein [Rhizomicrobium sp.]
MPEEVDYRLIGRLTIAYMMTVIGEVLRSLRVDFIDLLIVTAIANANNGGGETKRGISRNAVSRMLNVPLETVRRRVIGLIEKRALAEQHDGLVYVDGTEIGLGGNEALDVLNLEQLRQLFRTLKANGIELE